MSWDRVNKDEATYDMNKEEESSMGLIPTERNYGVREEGNGE